MTHGRRAVFLDRDGVLNEVVERDGEPASPRTMEQFRLVPDIDDVHRLHDAGFLLFVITNQPDIARGAIARDVVDRMLDRIRARVPLDDVRVCIHDDAAACPCRKPKPGMITDLARHWHVDTTRSWVIGDTWRDVGAAHAAGARAALIRRPYNADVRADVEVETLRAAVDAVLAHDGEET